MEKFIKGQVVIFPFPFSDLSGSKRRPALVLASLTGDDLICCQITSQFNKDEYSISLTKEDFIKGSLPVPSMIRPNRLFTVDKKIILGSAGTLSSSKVNEVVQRLLEFFK
jgi:mRNA interferase MazF